MENKGDLHAQTTHEGGGRKARAPTGTCRHAGRTAEGAARRACGSLPPPRRSRLLGPSRGACPAPLRTRAVLETSWPWPRNSRARARRQTRGSPPGAVAGRSRSRTGRKEMAAHGPRGRPCHREGAAEGSHQGPDPEALGLRTGADGAAAQDALARRKQCAWKTRLTAGNRKRGRPRPPLSSCEGHSPRTPRVFPQLDPRREGPKEPGGGGPWPEGKPADGISRWETNGHGQTPQHGPASWGTRGQRARTQMSGRRRGGKGAGREDRGDFRSAVTIGFTGAGGDA